MKTVKAKAKAKNKKEKQTILPVLVALRSENGKREVENILYDGQDIRAFRYALAMGSPNPMDAVNMTRIVRKNDEAQNQEMAELILKDKRMPASLRSASKRLLELRSLKNDVDECVSEPQRLFDEWLEKFVLDHPENQEFDLTLENMTMHVEVHVIPSTSSEEARSHIH